MKILVFTEGTTIMHAGAAGLSREEIVRQVQSRQVPVTDYASYLPIGRTADKLQTWKRQGAQIAYLTSRTKQGEIALIQSVLNLRGFPDGELFSRGQGEQYKDVVERVLPDILIEDDCESIGGEAQMISPHLKSELKARVKCITVKEFGGIDHLPDSLSDFASRLQQERTR